MKILLVRANDTLDSDRRWAVWHKGDTALREGVPFFLPEFSENISASMTFAVRTHRVGKFISKRFSNRYYDRFTFALNFVAEDILRYSQENGLPNSIATSFDGCAAFGEWQSISNCDNVHFKYNDNIVSRVGGIDASYFDLIDEAIEMLSKYYTIKIGDVIMLSLDMGYIDSLSIGDNIKIDIDNTQILSVDIK